MARRSNTWSKSCGPPELLVGMLHENCVQRGMVLSEIRPITTGMISNEAVCEFSRGHDDLIPFANISPFMAADRGQALERYVLEIR